ncbi:MAG TPA: aldo/keto reductase [Steroidobacteraceae bacterium]|nr:aldo/keto reductase [Steroidobacteraceae bacterium]
MWGEPRDRAEALRTLHKLRELHVNFIDTADSYAPEVSERLLREALHPYTGLIVATKGGFVRRGPDMWAMNGQPDYLIKQAHRSRELLGVERIDLWQLHRIDSKVPRDEQFAAVEQLLDTGVIRYACLSEVSSVVSWSHSLRANRHTDEAARSRGCDRWECKIHEQICSRHTASIC